MNRIRKADIPDMSAIVELGRELLDRSVFADAKQDETKFKRTVAGMMGHKNGVVLVVVDDENKPQGFLFGVIEDLFFSTQRYATDVAVYVRDGYRQYAPKLYKEFIRWAENKPKVFNIQMAQSSGIGDHQRWCLLMEKLGFTGVGSFYMKRVAKCHK